MQSQQQVKIISETKRKNSAVNSIRKRSLSESNQSEYLRKFCATLAPKNLVKKNKRINSCIELGENNDRSSSSNHSTLPCTIETNSYLSSNQSSNKSTQLDNRKFHVLSQLSGKTESNFNELSSDSYSYESSIEMAQREVTNIRDIMHNNIMKIYDREYKLDALEYKANELTKQSSDLKITAKKVKKANKKFNFITFIIIASILVVIAVTVIVPIVTYTVKSNRLNKNFS